MKDADTTVGNPDDALDARTAIHDSAEVKLLTRRFDWIVAGAIVAIFFLFYFATSYRWAFPGQSAHLLALLTGAKPNTMFEHYLWQNVYGGVIALAGTGSAVEAATILGMVFSSLSLGLAYLTTTALYVLLIDKTPLKLQAQAGAFHSAFAARFGGMVTTLALAFSAPFWVAASRVNFYAIYLFWMLVCAYLMLRFMANGSLPLLFTTALLYGMGMSQSATMILFSPAFVGMAFMGLLRANKLNYLNAALVSALAVVGWVALFLVSLYGFEGTRGYALMEFWGETQLGMSMLRSLFAGVLHSLPRSGWLIILGLVSLPWIAWLIVSFRTLNGESGPALTALDLAILVVTLVVVLDSRVSPWQFFGFLPEQVVLYTMAAMSLGYCFTAAYMRTVCLLSSRTEHPWLVAAGKATRIALVAAAGVLIAYEVGIGYVHAETRNTRFIHVYVDRLLDNLKGRTWLVTDGVFDDMLLLRAAERGMELNLIDLANASSAVQKKLMKEKLDSARLKNSLDIGALSFLQEWIESDPKVTRKLAFCLFPDLWSIGDYKVYPHGLVFFGEDRASDAESAQIADAENVARYFALMDEMEVELATVSDRSARMVKALADTVRRRVSFIGNNLGYFMETHGHAAEALEIYRRVHAFDPKNVSAMLNFASTLERAGLKDELAVVRTEIETFRKSQKKPLQIWELSRTQGYVNSPEAFSYLGWTWAMSGQNTIALKTLAMALGNQYEYGTTELMLAMADIYARQGETGETASILETLLKDDPDDVKSLLSLARLKMVNGETEEAKTLLDKARATGVPASRILREEATLLLATGDLEGAKTALAALIAEAPRDADARLSLYLALARDLGKTKDEAQRKALLAKMQAQIEEMARLPDARYFQAAIARGHYRLVENDLPGAREDFLVANKTSPGLVPILELILRIDYNLKDLGMARQHAVEILQIAPDHPFANYIMGSIALSRGEYDSADAYLEKSIARDASVLATGDLAYVKFKLEDIERALDLVTSALGRTQEIYEIWDTYGQILLKQNRLAEAEEALRMALKLNVRNPAVHLHLAQVLARQNRRDESKAVLEQIQPFESSLYGEERRDYDALWLEVFGTEKHKAEPK